MEEFAGRKVAITGAAGGLGTAMVTLFRAIGASVLPIDLADRVGDDGIACDITDDAALTELLSGAGVDTLINNAAIFPMEPFEAQADATFRRVIEVNALAATSSVRAVLPGMRAAGFGRIINITSITLSGQWENLASYVGSKGMLLGLTRAWAREFGPHGITVNAISPGAIPTEAEKIHPDPKAYNATVLERQAIKKRGSPEDIARTAAFAASRSSGFITGHTFHVNGGWVME